MSELVIYAKVRHVYRAVPQSCLQHVIIHFLCLYGMLLCYNSQSIFSSCVLNLVMFMKVMVLGPTPASYTNSTQDRVTN